MDSEMGMVQPEIQLPTEEEERWETERLPLEPPEEVWSY